MESEDGLDDLVLACVAGMDADVKADMLSDVVLVGGSAALPGLRERLEQDVMAIVPEHLCERVHVRRLDPGVLRHRYSANAICSRPACDKLKIKLSISFLFNDLPFFTWCSGRRRG